MKRRIFPCVLLYISSTLFAQEKPFGYIRLNQTGFYPLAKKIAVIVSEDYTEFYIATPDLVNNVFTGRLSEVRQSPYSPRKTRIADFTSLHKPGNYVLVVPNLGYSYPFEIRSNVHEDITKASVKGFYYQRFSLELTEQYAGKWKRSPSFSHHEIMIHPSAASDKRPAGTIISSPRGWIDAGDYNKYIVNSGITMGTLLSAYEDFEGYYDTLKLAIPESNNDLPDILDEVLWNLRWMLTMQDPNDGGVYHKCTNARFDPMVMPHEASTPRYVVQKGTAAALNFCAVMAQASRVLKTFESKLPGLADSCLQAAKNAWEWAKQNPDSVYDQKKINEMFDPDIVTGEYGDRNFSDEVIWAISELYATTKDDQYKDIINIPLHPDMPLPSWNQVKVLGYYTLIRLQKELPREIQPMISDIKKALIKKAKTMILSAEMHPYQTVMGASVKDFVWGSSSVAANQGILLVQAYRVTNNRKYLNFALHNLDYLLGRNATGYSFLTGYGDKTPMHIHHRPSEADGVAEPVPGLLAGGPNPGMQDKCNYPSSIPDEAYIDDVCSYASNEIAINWNAPLVYLAGAIEALQFKAQFSKK